MLNQHRVQWIPWDGLFLLRQPSRDAFYDILHLTQRPLVLEWHHFHWPGSGASAVNHDVPFLKTSNKWLKLLWSSYVGVILPLSTTTFRKKVILRALFVLSLACALSKIVGGAYSRTAAYHQGADCDALPSHLGSSHVIRSHKNKNNSNTVLMILLECQEVHITNQKLMSSKVWGQRNFHLRNVPRIYSFGLLMDGINFTSLHIHKFWCFQQQFETMWLSQQQCCLTRTSCSVPDFHSGN